MQIRALQYLRGIAAIAVVLYHIELWEEKAVGPAGLLPHWFAIGNAGVDLFFVISGFIMLYIQPARIDSAASYGRFLYNRFTRIYPSYWIVLLLLLPVWMVRPKLFNSYYNYQVDILRSFLLLPQEYLPLLRNGWTLIHEVYFYVIVSIALLFSRRGRWIFGCLWFVLVLALFLRFGDAHFGNNRYLQLAFSPFSLTFLLGCFIALCHSQIRRLPPAVLLGVFVAGVVGLVMGHARMPDIKVYPDNNYLCRFIGYGLPCSLMVLGAVGVDASIKRTFRAMVVLGDSSYALYLSHLLVVAGVYTVARLEHHRGVLPVAATAITSLAASLIVAVAFHHYFERKIIRVARNLIEAKPPAVVRPVKVPDLVSK